MAGFPATKSGTVKTTKTTDAPKHVANTSTAEQSQASVSKTSKTPKTVDSGSASLKTIRNGTTLTGQSQPQKSAYNPMEDIIMTVTKPKTPQRVTVNAAFDAWHNTMNTLANERKEKEAQAKAEAEQKEYKQLQAELDRIDASRAYVTTTEQSDELEKERKQVVERMRELGGSGTSTEEQQRSNSLENTKLAIDQGLTQADHRIAQTVDWLFGGIAKEGKALLNATLQSVNPEWGFEDEDPFITKYNKRGEEVLAANEQEAQSRIAEGTLNKNVWQYAPQVVAAVPDAVLALMSGGSTAAAQASTKALTTAQPIAAAVKNMASSPMWLSSFAQSAGSSYNSAIAEGATEEQASLYALLNGFANATIEVGGGDEALGGMQKLPQQIQEAIKRGDSNLILKWVKNIASEAGEEVTQGLTEKALRGVYTNDVPLYSATDENAVINPARAKEEAIGGAIVSAILGGGQMALQAGANGGVAKALPSKQQSTHKTGEDILMETVLGENAKKSAQQPQVSTETQGDIPAPVTAQEAKQDGFDELNSASNVNDAETKAESMTWEEKARAEAKEQAWAEYEDAVGRYWRENPFATSIPKTLENGARWVEDRVNAILKKNAANGELDDYVRSVNKLEAKTPDMTERATQNKADAFSAAPHDSAIEARQAEWNRFGKTKVDKAATEAPVNETDYHRGRESYYSDRAEPKGLRVGKQYIEEFGPKKYDPAQDKDLPSTKLDYIIDSALRAESNGIDARAAQALDMLRNGTSPSDVYSKLGLVVKANGDITDGIGGDVLWRSTKKGEKNGQAGSDAGNNSVREEYRSAEAGVSVNVGRGVESVGSGAQKNARSWETLDTNEREAARELIQRKIDAADSDEAYDMREVYGDDSELARAIYKSYTEGDISLEQRWTSYFGDMGKLADELDAALGSKAAAAQRTAKADTTQSRSANTDENGTAADTGSDTTGRTYVDKNGNEYDPKTGYTTRAAEDVNDERDAHVTDDLYYTLRAEDKLTLDNAKEWARLQQEERNRRERQEDIPDDVAWQDAEAVYGSKSHEAINDAVTRATEHETFLEKSEFLNSLNNDSKREAVAAEVAGFKSKLKGLGDGHVSFDEFSDYYGALKNNSTLGDLYSERVNEQVQQAKEYMNEACENPSPYTVDKFRRTATNAVQMATHYIEKAGRVREQLNKLNANVRKNGKKPFETERNPSFVERAKSAAQKVAAGYEHWQIMPRQMFQKIDGFDKWGGGEGYKIAQEIDKATALEQRVFVESQGFFTDVMKNRKAYAAFSTGKTKSGVYVDGRQLSMDEAVTMYMAIRTMGGPTAYRAQNADGFAIKNGKADPAIVNVEHISELYEDLRRAISKDPVAKSYVQAFANMATHNGKAAQEVKSRIDGITVEMLGEGMYFPLSYTSATEANQNWDSESKRDFGLPDIGLMRERTRAAGGYINIAPITEVTDSYIRQIANYTAWGELADTFSVMDKMHTFGTSSLTDTVKRYMGDEYGKWMQNYINDVQNTNVERAKVKGGFWRSVTRNFQSAVLVGNPGTPFKQKGSMWLAMSELDPRAVAKASVTSLNPWSKKMKEAREHPQIGYRALGNIDASISDALNNESTLIGKAAEKIGIIRSIVNWIPAADVKEVSKVYLAAYYDVQMKNPGMDVNSDAFKQKVDDTFTSACLHTQAQYNMNYRDEVSRSDNDLMKALTMFQTQQRANYNSLMTAFGEAKAAKGTKHESEANKTLKNAVGGFLASNVAYGLMNVVAQALRHKLKPFRDDEDEEQQLDPVKILKEIGKGFAEGVGGTFMFGDTATNAVLSVLTDETFYENGVGAADAIGDAISAAVKLSDNPSADNVRKAAGSIANLAGIPLNNAYTLLNSVLMYAADIANAASTKKTGVDFLLEATKGTSAADVMGKNKTDLYKFSDDPADDTLKLLDSIRKAVNSFAPKEFTFEDGSVYTLDKEEREQYRKTAETTYLTGVEALLATAGYSRLSGEAREELRGAMKSYAKDVAAKDYLGFDEEWENNLSEKEVPQYLVGKKILTVSDDEANYDAIDFLIGRFDKLKPNVRQQLKEQSGLNVSKLLYSDSFDVDAETYYNGKNAIKRGAEKLGETDAAAAISVYNSMAGQSDSEIFDVIKTQITPGSDGKPATIVRRIEAYNTVAGDKADLGKWLNLLAALNDADVNNSISKADVYAAWANIGLSSSETYAGISRDDFYKLVKGNGGYASDENYATQFDEVYAALVPTEQEEKATLSGSVRK